MKESHGKISIEKERRTRSRKLVYNILINSTRFKYIKYISLMFTKRLFSNILLLDISVVLITILFSFPTLHYNQHLYQHLIVITIKLLPNPNVPSLFQLNFIASIFGLFFVRFPSF